MNTQKLLKLVSSIALASCFAAPAHAGFITGSIKLTGPISFTGSGIGTGIHFLNPTTTDDAIAGEGSYLNVPLSTAATHTDFTFGTNALLNTVQSMAITNFWSFTADVDPTAAVDNKTFSFDLETLKLEFHNSSFLNVSGTGMLKGTGYDATPGTWTFSANRNGTSKISFDSTNTAVPEPLSLSLLGIGIASLAAKRKANKLAIA